MKHKKHVGSIHPAESSHYLDGHGSKDPHASAEHHAANKAHGMPQGMSPTYGNGEGDEEGGQEGGKGMAENGSP